MENRLVFIFFCLCWITVASSVRNSQDCDLEKLNKARDCVISNNQKYVALKKASHFNELQRLQHLNATCHTNANCFENLEHCDMLGRLSNRRQCKTVEFLLRPQIQKCIEIMKKVQTQNECVANFLAVFLKNARDKKTMCSVYRSKCVEQWMVENCQDSVQLIREFQQSPNYMQIVSRC